MLALGFVIWNIWNERNMHIFKDKAREPLFIINQILKQLKETVRSILRTNPSNPPLPHEVHILNGLNLQFLNPQEIKKNVRNINTGDRGWQPPRRAS